MSIEHVGRVENKHHHASPVVIGDFELMKQWQGDMDGEAEGEMDLGEGNIFGFTAMELGAPTIFIEDNVVTLLTPEGMTPVQSEVPEPALLASLVVGDLDSVEEEGTLAITSGAIVVSLAYHATPEEGAPTDHIGECYHADLPTLPRVVPTEITHQTELAIIPIKPGDYKIVWGYIGGYERCQIVLA